MNSKLIRQALLLAVTTVSLVVCQTVEEICNDQTSCRDCIRADPDCAWCKQEGYDVNTPRCFKSDVGSSSSCSRSSLENPTGQVTDSTNDLFNELNQIRPLNASISLRPNQPQSYVLEVQPSNNYPIDLYLLMDLSYSMKDDLAKLKTLGAQLSERIEQITPNFRLGFGSFVDKRLGSFVDLNPNKLLDPCFPFNCQSPYSYHHIVNLTGDNALFARRVDQQVISGNKDPPEGGFDGFLQSIVCKEMVGWRPISRKLLLYLTDAGFHFAGDGLLGGVIRPHDGKCHMKDLRPDSTGNIVYQDWDVLDYPSIGQISEKMDAFDIIPIFAVVESAQAIYKRLVDELGRDRAHLGILAADSSNIVDLVEDLYYRISQRIIFVPENVPGLSIKVTPKDCPGRVVDGLCTGVTINQRATFTVEATVTECTEELAAGPRLVTVRVIGFGTFDILVNPLCNCSCIRIEDSTLCSGRGNLVCGVCECDHGFFGELCQCNSTGVDSTGTVLKCPLGIEKLECSGRGVCTCGVCKCRKGFNGEDRFSGKACECDISLCKSDNKICSGSAQGECRCGECRCLKEPTTGLLYKGKFCSCSPNTQTCRDPNNSTDICNGRGQCKCGECFCSSPYFGTYCELCSGSKECKLVTCDLTGPSGICSACTINLLQVFHSNNVSVDELFTENFFRAAISNGTLPRGSRLEELNGERAIYLPDSFSRECDQSAKCTPLVIINQSQLLDYEILGFLSTRCQYDPLDCDYHYRVALNTTDGTKLPIHVEYPPICPRRSSGSSLAIPPWAIALILILILLLLGLLALALLKLLLMLLDWIEVRRFEKELGKTKYTKNENPLFHSPQKEYKNPIYGK